MYLSFERWIGEILSGCLLFFGFITSRQIKELSGCFTMDRNIG